MLDESSKTISKIELWYFGSTKTRVNFSAQSRNFDKPAIAVFYC